MKIVIIKRDCGCLGWLIFLIMLFFIACTKDYGYLNTDRRDLHKYQFYIDHYSKDTTRIGVRTLAGQWMLPQDKCGGMDTIKAQWFLNCVTDSIENWYYLTDGKGYETKLQPTRVDTIWINYNK